MTSRAFFCVGGEFVATLNDDLHADLRRACAVPEDFVARTFDFAKLSAGGGKGGDAMARTEDGKYFVKRLNANDHAVLKDRGFMQSLVNHITETFDVADCTTEDGPSAVHTETTRGGETWRTAAETTEASDSRQRPMGSLLARPLLHFTRRLRNAAAWSPHASAVGGLEPAMASSSQTALPHETEKSDRSRISRDSRDSVVDEVDEASRPTAVEFYAIWTNVVHIEPLRKNAQVTYASVVAQHGTASSTNEDNSDSPIPFDELYDIKGSADDKLLAERGERVADVHKRCYRLGWLLCEATYRCGIPDDRQRYVAGKYRARTTVFRLSEKDRSALLRSLERDVAWLKARGLMDYSIIVGRTFTHGAPSTARAMGDSSAWTSNERAPPLVYLTYNSGHEVSHVGIIDYLQCWTVPKRLAWIIKASVAPRPISTIPPAAYAEQFMRDMTRRWVGEKVAGSCAE